jgi:hypothetical protein
MAMACSMEATRREEMALTDCAGKLDISKSIDWETHLANCPDCRSLARNQKKVWDSLDEWTAPAVSPAFDRRLYEKIALSQQTRWWRSILPSRIAIPAAAACAAVLAALLIQPVPRGLPDPHAKADTVEIEQVDQALEDLEMLKQLSASAHGEAQRL